MATNIAIPRQTLQTPLLRNNTGDIDAMRGEIYRLSGHRETQ